MTEKKYLRGGNRGTLNLESVVWAFLHDPRNYDADGNVDEERLVTLIEEIIDELLKDENGIIHADL